MPCAAAPSGATFASNLIGYADCQARTIGQAGYQALAAPTGSIPALLAILITILVALIGYRLILGETPTVREGVLTFVKLGVVLAFATGWSAYRPVVYDVVMDAPVELASRIDGASGLPGGESLAAHLNAVDGQFQQLAIENVDRPAVSVQSGPVPPPLFANFDVFALGSARIVFLTGALASYAAPKLLAGLLLALGPLFIAFLLFDATRGLVEAWLGALAGAALAAIAAAIVLGVELAMLEPWLAAMINRRIGGEATPGMASELLVITMVFNVVMLIACWGMALTASRLRLAVARSVVIARAPAPAVRTDRSEQANFQTRDRSSSDRSRASAIAEAAATLHRRENAPIGAGRAAVTALGGERSTNSSIISPAARGASPSRRRTLPRRSNSAARRDRTS